MTYLRTNLSELWTRIEGYLPQVLAALPVAIAIAVGAMLLGLIIDRAVLLLARRTHVEQSDLLPLRQITRWLLRIIAAVLILGVFGFRIGGLWAVISTVLGLVAIGFVAMWSLLSHSTATQLILFLRPYQVGDDLEFPGDPVRGRVVDLNFFYTTLVDHEGALFQIPNNLFFQKVLRRRRNQPPVRLAYQLNNPMPAEVPLPPPPPAKPESPKDDSLNPVRSGVDPHTLHPSRR